MSHLYVNLCRHSRPKIRHARLSCFVWVCMCVCVWRNRRRWHRRCLCTHFVVVACRCHPSQFRLSAADAYQSHFFHFNILVLFFFSSFYSSRRFTFSYSNLERLFFFPLGEFRRCAQCSHCTRAPRSASVLKDLGNSVILLVYSYPSVHNAKTHDRLCGDGVQKNVSQIKS